jgi:hypothetical protein
MSSSAPSAPSAPSTTTLSRVERIHLLKEQGVIPTDSLRYDRYLINCTEAEFEEMILSFRFLYRKKEPMLKDLHEIDVRYNSHRF